MASLNKQVEKAHSNFVWIKLYCDNLYDETKIYLIDVDVLKNMYNSGPLEGATVFAYLFGIDDNTPFKKEENYFETEIDLTDFRVNLKTWVLFYGFLRNGFLSKSSMLYKDDVYEFVIAMGGVPSFENYYKNINKIPEIYNPMTPEEDFNGKYRWSVVSIPTGHYGSIHGTELGLLNSTDSITVKISEHLPRFYARRSLLSLACPNQN